MPLTLWLILAAYGVLALLSFSLAFLALSFGVRQPLNLSFAWLGACLAGWGITAIHLRVLLWLDFDAHTIFYASAIPFYLVGPALLTFIVRYLQLPTRWPNRLTSFSLAALVLAAPALFRGQLIANPEQVRANGAVLFEVTPWGVPIGALPVLFIGYACWLLWQQRRNTRDPYLALSAFGLLLGMLLEMVLGTTLFITPFVMILSVGLLGYGITHQQLFNPLRARTEALRREINERERAEQALRESEAKFRNILEASPMGAHLYELNPQGQLIFSGCNPAADWILGVRNEQFIGKTIEDAFPNLADTEVPERYRRACTDGEPWYNEQITYADNHVRGAFEVHAFSYAPGKMVAMFLDITQRKQAEEALELSKAAEMRFADQLAQLISTLNVLTTTNTVDKLARQAVESGCKVLNVDRLGIWFAAPDGKSMLGSYGIDEQGRLRDERGSVTLIDSNPLVAQIFAAKEPHHLIDFGLLKSDKDYIGVEGPYAIAPIWDGQRVTGMISADNLFSQRPFSPRDGELLELYATSLGHLVALKQAQEAVHKLSEELEVRVDLRTAELQQKNRELETFTYSVSHDLKAPLRGIQGYASLLEETYADQLDDEGRLFIKNIRSGTALMHQLIDDLLAYSRLERHSQSKLSLQLPALVDQVVAEYAPQIETRGIRLKIHLDCLQASADPDGIAQALGQLINNALKFTLRVPEPEIEIGSRAQPGACLLWVRDNGVGFDMRYHDRIFQIFQRLHLPEDYPGTGIGLALVRKVMELNGGHTWAESALNQGATFYLAIPRAEPIQPE